MLVSAKVAYLVVLTIALLPGAVSWFLGNRLIRRIADPALPELLALPTGKAEFDAFCGSLALAKWMHSTGHDINGGDYRPITLSGASKPKRTTRKAA